MIILIRFVLPLCPMFNDFRLDRAVWRQMKLANIDFSNFLPMNNNEFCLFVSNYNSKTTHSRQFVSSISSFLIAICIEKQLNERKSFLIILFFLSSTWQFRWENYFFSIPHSTWCRSSGQHHINLTREQTVSWCEHACIFSENSKGAN